MARLASLKAQRDYIVHGTAHSYYLPSELLDDADGVIRQVRERGAVRDSLPDAAVEAILQFGPLLVDAGLAVDTSASNEELIEADGAWRRVRDHAAMCLRLLDFDLTEWEKTETRGIAQPGTGGNR